MCVSFIDFEAGHFELLLCIAVFMLHLNVFLCVNFFVPLIITPTNPPIDDS